MGFSFVARAEALVAAAGDGNGKRPFPQRGVAHFMPAKAGFFHGVN